MAPLKRKNTTWLPTCHSTNTYAAEWAKLHPIEDGWVVYTFHQTNGRGQSGNKWESEPEKNLTFSVVYTLPFLLPKDQFRLNMVVSLALISFLGKNGFAAEIKWPNDIYIGGKKVGGILIENQIRGSQFRFSVIGVGLNVNQTSFSINSATSLQLLAGRGYELGACLEGLLNCLEEQIVRLKEGTGVVEEYYLHLYRMGIASTFRSVQDNITFVGTIQGVDEQGRLMLLTEMGIRFFELKEVAFI